MNIALTTITSAFPIPVYWLKASMFIVVIFAIINMPPKGPIKQPKTTRKEMNETERAFCRGIFAASSLVEGGISLKEVSDLVFEEYGHRRDSSTYSRFRGGNSWQTDPRTKRGRPRNTTAAEDAALVSKLQELQEIEKGEVTARVILAAITLVKSIAPASLSRRFRALDLRWRPVTRKLDLSVADKQESLNLAQLHAHLTAEFWNTHVLFIVNKSCSCRTTSKGRTHALTTSVRGGYRRRRTKLYKPSVAKHRHGDGQRNITICGAYGDGRCLFAHVVEGRWNAQQYETIVNGPLRQALGTMPPGSYVVRDNDRTGYTSKKGLRAERDALGPQTVRPLSKRRPDLNPLDYYFHHRINVDMIAEEATWDNNRGTERRAEFKARLLAKYAAISEADIRGACGSMKRRLELVIQNNGGHIPRD